MLTVFSTGAFEWGQFSNKREFGKRSVIDRPTAAEAAAAWEKNDDKQEALTIMSLSIGDDQIKHFRNIKYCEDRIEMRSKKSTNVINHQHLYSNL